MRSALVCASIAVAAAAGCGLFPGAVPDWVANREPLDSCGTEDAGQGERIDRGARACLLEAFRTGRGAELTSTETSVEGDPITSIIRVHPDGTVEVFLDMTQDAFGSGAWERLRCTALVPVDDVNDPPNLVLPDEMVFIQDGCEPVPVNG